MRRLFLCLLILFMGSIIGTAHAPAFAMAHRLETREQRNEEITRLRQIAPPNGYFSEADKDIYTTAVAIHAGFPLDKQVLQKLGSRINDPGKNKLTLLYYAAYLLNLDATAALLDAGADPLFPCDDELKGLWPNLVESSAVGNKALDNAFLRVLLDHGVSPNLKPMPDGKPLVYSAARWVRPDNFKLLIDRGADPWAQPEKGIDPIVPAMEIAATMGNYGMLAYAIDHGALKGASTKKIEGLMSSVDIVWLRDDPLSRQVVAITRKVIAETAYAGDEHTHYILDFGEKYFAHETLIPTRNGSDGDEKWVPFDKEIDAVADKISRNTPLTEADIAAIKDKINKPYSRPELSLLSVAAQQYQGDIHNIEMLFAAGANPNTIAEMVNGQNSFVTIAFLDAGYIDFPKEPLRKLYFRYHGDPNTRLYSFGLPLAAEVIRNRAYQSIEGLIDAGADLWAAPRGQNQASAMELLITNAESEGGIGAYNNFGFSEPVAWQVIGYAAQKGLFRNAPPDRLNSFMMEVTRKCPYFEKFRDTVTPALRDIFRQTGFRTDDICVQHLTDG